MRGIELERRVRLERRLVDGVSEWAGWNHLGKVDEVVVDDGVAAR